MECSERKRIEEKGEHEWGEEERERENERLPKEIGNLESLGKPSQFSKNSIAFVKSTFFLSFLFLL
jgi:hypothetical protein